MNEITEYLHRIQRDWHDTDCCNSVSCRELTISSQLTLLNLALQ